MNIFKITLLVCLIFTANYSSAQFDKNRPQIKGEIDSLMKIKLTSETGIDQTTTDKFFEAYKVNNIQIRELKKEKREVMKLIKTDPSALDVGTKLDKLIELDYDIFKKRKAFMEDLKTFMTPQQIAETFVFMKDFSREFRDKIRKDRRKREK